VRGRYLLVAGFCGLAIALAAAAYSIVTRQYNPAVIGFAALFLTGSVGLLLTQVEGEVRKRSGHVASILQLCTILAVALLLLYVGMKIHQAFPH
jgi:drug/metabolite transporter (DMT)-like permease